ncbi:hypothetical protein LUW76_03205 [Actinomadura madurae]|uniref:hypothetical protein n=1 Tax=Actinomadura madurae TaxID=1993 RepID=UPI002026240F|nr:hypothetical protein [Actinomadura madurae]MCP9964515.1 hypothetical protein [Actinomadura madurae]URM93413.1 hypothetical protein LUW76_03205 [Actinomadura madurae]URN04143.1 hypothetical protein LUW74_12945 [Actinomadura madurae]
MPHLRAPHAAAVAARLPEARHRARRRGGLPRRQHPPDAGTPDELPAAGQADVMQMRNPRRWLRETGVDARERLGHLPLPPEPV